MSLFNKIVKNYNKYPLWVLRLIGPLFNLLPVGLRLGKGYRTERRIIKENEGLSEPDVIEKQNESFKKLIAYSYEHVKYYRELLDGLGLKPRDFKTVKDITKIPFLTKEIVFQRQNDLISDECSKEKLCYVTTSGSTGTPVGFFVDKNSSIRDVAYVYHFFNEIGYSPKSSKLLMRGKEFYSQKRGHVFQWDPLKKELSIDIFSFTEENLEIYCKAIEKYKPDFVYGYPSAMCLFCNYLSKRKEPLRHNFKGFIAISESLSNEQSSFIESVISAPVVTFYGMSERVIIAKKCLKTGQYHIEPLYGLAEIVDKKGNEIKTNGIIGELVGTSLVNYCMPLIRYKTGDMSSWSNSSCCCSNRFFSLANVYGRKNRDVLINKENQPISMASLEIHSDAYQYIKRYQFYQEKPGFVTIRIVPSCDSFDNEKIDEIKNIFTNRTQGKIVF